MKIKVTRWSSTSSLGALYSSAYPSNFEVEDCVETIITEELVREIADMVKDARKEDDHTVYAFSYSGRIPYNNVVVVGGGAVFILLQESHVVGGMSWKEAVYILWKQDGIIKGREYTIGSGTSYHSWATHHRYLLNEIEGKAMLRSQTKEKHSQGEITESESEIIFPT